MMKTVLTVCAAVAALAGWTAETPAKFVLTGGHALDGGTNAPFAVAFAEAAEAELKCPVRLFVVPAGDTNALKRVADENGGFTNVIALPDVPEDAPLYGDAAAKLVGETMKAAKSGIAALGVFGGSPYNFPTAQRVAQRFNCVVFSLQDFNPPLFVSGNRTYTWDRGTAKAVARRVVRATAKPYRFFWSNLGYAQPVPGRISREGDELVVSFDTPALGGKSLVLCGLLDGAFEIAPATGSRWYKAQAMMDGNAVRVRADEVKEPVRVRFRWYKGRLDSPLCNCDRVPAIPFEAAFNDWDASEAEEVRHVIRPGGIAQEAFWNVNAKWFAYAPSFPFTNRADAAAYRFTLELPKGSNLVFTAKSAGASLKDVWSQVPVGAVTARCEAVSADGRSLGCCGSRAFGKIARFTGRYPARSLPYGEAAARTFDYILSWPSMTYISETGKPDPKYPLNCYPTKMYAAVADAFSVYAKSAKGARREAALKLVRAGADYLLSIQAKDGPLESFPPTYVGKGLTEATAASCGQNMLCYPAEAGLGLLRAYGQLHEKKYLDAAKRIAERYLALQGEDGTWYLKLNADGTPVSPNRLMPMQVVDFLELLFRHTNDVRYRAAADRAFAFVEAGPVKTWNWEGQFEDVKPTPPYENLTKHDACNAAIHICRRYPDDPARIAVAREILRFAEDQFVCWERPYSPVWINVAWWFNVQAQTLYPGVLEQYHCYAVIDASLAKLIRTYLALYDVEKKPVDLAKARALGDSLTRGQNGNGRIRTFFHNWQDDNARDDWVNCMVRSAEALELLAAYE